MLSERRNGNGAEWRGQCASECPRERRAGAAIYSHQADRRLAAQEWRCEYIGWIDQGKIRSGIEARAEIGRQIYRNSADGDLARPGNISAG